MNSSYKKIKYVASITFTGLLLMSPTAFAAAPYLEVTYTVQLPIVELEDISATNNIGTWSGIRSSSNGTLRTDATELSGSGSATSFIYNFARSFYTFNTSAIPDDAVVESASLKGNIGYVDDNINNAYSYVALLQGNPASSTNITGADYANCGSLDDATLGSMAYDITNIASGTLQSFDLNSTGKSWINKTGYTTLCMRDGHDIENQPYSGSGSWIQNMVGFLR